VTIKTYFQPESVEEAVALLDAHGPSLLVKAGGTILMPLINEGISAPEQVMGLNLAKMDGIRRQNGSLYLGAMTTLSDMLDQGEVPLLSTAAKNVGAWAIRNMATVGGNLFAPPPSGDFTVALLALDARLKLVSQGGERALPLDQFYTGFMTNALKPGELVAGFEIPFPAGKTAYIKCARRQQNTPAIVTVAAHITLSGKTISQARLTLNGVGPHPMRASQAEEILSDADLSEATIEQAADAAAEECQPFSDPIASEWYRRKMTKVYVRRALAELAAA
jgi:carbon-monoxide dehydrogenase medium subunit